MKPEPRRSGSRARRALRLLACVDGNRGWDPERHRVEADAGGHRAGRRTRSGRAWPGRAAGGQPQRAPGGSRAGTEAAAGAIRKPHSEGRRIRRVRMVQVRGEPNPGLAPGGNPAEAAAARFQASIILQSWKPANHGGSTARRLPPTCGTPLSERRRRPAVDGRRPSRADRTQHAEESPRAPNPIG